MAIYYFSMDMDGCLFNSAYIKAVCEEDTKRQSVAERRSKALIDNNRTILAKIAKQQKKASATYGFIGSVRQSMFIDKLNGMISGSCIPAMETLCTHLECELDPFLLADLDGQLEGGTSFNLIKSEVAKEGWYGRELLHQHADNENPDEFKRVLLFAQMQKAALDQAKLHPGEPIVFDFFDDKSSLLNVLKKYFESRPHMIPQGVTLNLWRYAGTKVSHVTSIQGKGAIYENYPELVGKMSQNLGNLYEFDPRVESTDTPEKEETWAEKLMTGLKASPLYFADMQSGEEAMKKNPALEFFLRPSSATIEGYLTFSVTFMTDKMLASHRYGINRQGQLFIFNNETGSKNEILIDKNPESIIANIAAEVALTKQKVAELEDISPIMFTPSVKNTSSMENGFFAPRKTLPPRHTASDTPGIMMK